MRHPKHSEGLIINHHGTVGSLGVDPRQGAAGIMEAHPLLDEGYSSECLFESLFASG
jgi:hypothetical protein